MPYGPTQFHSTVIKPYYKDDSSKPLQNTPEDAPEKNHNQYTLEGNYNSNTVVVDVL